MTTTRSPLITTPQALSLLSQGIETLAAPLALTLGPGRGFVLNELNRHEFEVLADSSTIARRVIRLPGRGSNLGAMMLRKMALDLQERHGDGVATAAVMVRAMVRDAVRMIAAGANAALMIRGVRLAVEAACAALALQARPAVNQDELIALALSVTGDPELSELLGQMFDVLGEHATIITQDTAGTCLDHEYIRGGKWDGYIPARQILPDGEAGLVLHNPLLVLADEEITTVEQVQPMLELVLAQPGKPPLLLLARSVSDAALTMLVANHVRGVLTTGLLVLSSGGAAVHDDLEDIAALTGGQVLSAITGSLAKNIQLTSLGHAQRAILTENGVTIAGGAGKQPVVQRRIAEVRALLKHVTRDQRDSWDFLHLRLARLTGGVGVLKFGSLTEQEREIKQVQIGKTLRVLEAASEGGLVPGGGTAFLDCLPAVEATRKRCQHEDEVYGVALVEAALQAPFLQLVHNHGEVHPPLALAEVRRLGPGYGFDMRNGDYACLADRHILDSLHVTQGILEAAASVATMVMTTDTIVFTA